MSCTRYHSLGQLEVQRPEKIVRSEERRAGNILLFLRGGEEEGEFVSFTPSNIDSGVSRCETPERRKTRRGCQIKVKIYGYTNFDGGNRIIRISGKGFTRYLV